MKEGGGACYCHAEHSVKELRTQSSRRKSAVPVWCVQYNQCPHKQGALCSSRPPGCGRAVAPRARRRAARARSSGVVAAAMMTRAGRMRVMGTPHPHSSSRGALSKVVQDIFAAGGTPFAEQDPPTLSELGVLNILLSPPRKLDVQIPRTGCSLYSREMLVARSYKAIPALSEGALMARFVRQMTVLPMALVSDASFVAFARARPEVADVWDHYLVFDDAKATAALKSAHVAMPARLIRASSLWKLAGLLMSPFVRTLYLDSDVMVCRPRLMPALDCRADCGAFSCRCSAVPTSTTCCTTVYGCTTSQCLSTSADRGTAHLQGVQCAPSILGPRTRSPAMIGMMALSISCNHQCLRMAYPRLALASSRSGVCARCECFSSTPRRDCSTRPTWWTRRKPLSVCAKRTRR